MCVCMHVCTYACICLKPSFILCTPPLQVPVLSHGRHGPLHAGDLGYVPPHPLAKIDVLPHHHYLHESCIYWPIEAKGIRRQNKADHLLGKH